MTKSSFTARTNPEQAKIIEKVLQELAWISTNVGLLMKWNQEQVNVVSHQQPRAPIYEKSCSKEDTFLWQIRWGVFEPMLKGPIRTISSKVKRTKVWTLIGIMHIGTTTKMDTMTETRDMIEMVIGLYRHGPYVTQLNCDSRLVVRELRRCLTSFWRRKMHKMRSWKE